MNRAIAAFLSLIAWSEGTSTSKLTKDDGYDVLVSGVDGPAICSDYEQHPFATRPATLVLPASKLRLKPVYSTAAGRYQILFHLWQHYIGTLGLHGFGHDTQDLIALQLIKERFPIDSIVKGDIKDAIHACANCWASFPGNGYGQGGHSIETLTAQYQTILEALNQ